MTHVRGATREVFLMGRWAVKIPSLRSYKLFLIGLLANMQEDLFSRTGWPELCPVVMSLPWGWLVIMRRARPLTDAEWCALDMEHWPDRDQYTVPVEMKRDSFGVVDGRVVAIDYGS